MTMKTNSLNKWFLAFEVGSLVRHWRKIKNLTQKDLAEKVGTQQPSIARLEQFSNEELPTLSYLIKIAEAIGKTVEIRFK